MALVLEDNKQSSSGLEFKLHPVRMQALCAAMLQCLLSLLLPSRADSARHLAATAPTFGAFAAAFALLGRAVLAAGAY
jgi:hypothetical protein